VQSSTKAVSIFFHHDCTCRRAKRPFQDLVARLHWGHVLLNVLYAKLFGPPRQKLIEFRVSASLRAHRVALNAPGTGSGGTCCQGVVPISELVFGTLTQNRSSLEPARHALRTAVPLLLILRIEGGTE
jgi:hypothetical protein